MKHELDISEVGLRNWVVDAAYFAQLPRWEYGDRIRIRELLEELVGVCPVDVAGDKQLRIVGDSTSEIYSDSPCARYLLAGLYNINSGHDRAALMAFDRAILTHPTCFEGHHLRAIALFNLRDLEEALSAVEMALEICPDDSYVLANRNIILECLVESGVDSGEKGE